MGHVTTKDEVNLYFEESGTGTPVIFILNKPATTEVGSRRCATFQDGIAASHITRAAIRRQTYRRIRMHMGRI